MLCPPTQLSHMASGGVGSAAVRIASKLGCRVVAMTTSAAKVAQLALAC
jgi:NADPH:quinone reductase-like Zn-dependent oxidoreductase